jgi:hypothetical protein
MHKNLLDLNTVKQDIYTWIETFLEKSNPELNNWPVCPYAKKARLENKIDIRLGQSIETDLTSISTSWSDNIDVVVLVYSIEQYSSKETTDLVEILNFNLLMPKDLLVLEDHPFDKEIINGVCVNQGQYILLLVQRLSKIQQASRDLKNKGYYKLWSKEYYDRVVGWREQYEAEHKIQS